MNYFVYYINGTNCEVFNYEDVRRFSKILRMLSEGCANVSDNFPKIVKDFRVDPKMARQ